MKDENGQLKPRYEVDQIYMKQFPIFDTEQLETLAVCPDFDDYNWDRTTLVNEAKARAQSICDALNAAGYDWQPPAERREREAKADWN